jgi:hypothetical protein
MVGLQRVLHADQKSQGGNAQHGKASKTTGRMTA